MKVAHLKGEAKAIDCKVLQKKLVVEKVYCKC